MLTPWVSIFVLCGPGGAQIRFLAPVPRKNLRRPSSAVPKSCGTIPVTERWLSGRKQRFAKPSWAFKVHRGFESPPLRQFPQNVSLSANCTSRGGAAFTTVPNSGLSMLP
jgi:hypothetical protein